MKEIGILALCLIVIFLVGCQSETPKAEVDLLIEALPEVSDLTIYHQHQITMIREKIDELDDKERALVLEANLLRFYELETRMAVIVLEEENKSIALNISVLIASLPTVDNFTNNDEKTIEAIDRSLDSINSDYLYLIDQSLLDQYELFKTTLKNYQLDLAAAKEVNQLLLNLPTLDDFTLDYQSLIIEIDQRYLKLTPSQKQLVNGEILLLPYYQDKIAMLLYLHQEEQEELSFIELSSLLDELNNQEVEDDVELPVAYQQGSVQLTINWQSNSAAISSAGVVKRGLLNTNVTLTAKVQGEIIDKTITINLVVRGTRVVDMPTINPNKKLTFAYFRNPAYGTNLMERDYMKIDVLNYAFGKIVNGELSVSHLSNLEKVLKIREKGVRVVVVIDGVSTETVKAFVLAASTLENRQKLANSIANVLEQYQFDGVDLDWEFPSGTTQKNNFTLLVKEIREALDRSSRDLILSAAVISGSYSSHYDLVELNKYLDYLHIMTYGMSGSYVAKHQSALIRSTYAPYAIASSVEMYANGGIDLNKIVFGIPFYVKIGDVAGNPTNVLGASLTNPISISNNLFMRDYYNKNGMVEYYDAEAKVFYSYNGTKFASYDNPTSIRYKCEYAIEKGIAGVMFWDYGHDQEGGTLLDAIYQQFKLK
ncbi:MAG TPA: glycoside hydrolase family 18 protein [Bacilli bacterium]|nr:MAG: Chitinase A1 precursor [Tenericutes bacterium ADurb.BinA124]HNZ50909.1 glycoside hydrolase family 18 protein [Bacilli bacterium]HPX84447.1 glycoside hydrolase family 18 protein [Bacilli bacterium]HQC74930.1 glycoside hydrolase family 18 protein [Bacilli bacterium]